MEKRKLRKTIKTKYKFECVAISHKGKYLVQYETVGYIVLERRSKENALKEARRMLGRKVDNVNLVSKIIEEKVLSQCHPEVQNLIEKYGETIESEEFICEE